MGERPEMSFSMTRDHGGPKQEKEISYENKNSPKHIA
jgi:hypothetical protein